MKKLLCVLLALVMVLSFSTVAFAAGGSKDFTTVVDDAETDNVTENEASFDVTATADVVPGDDYADIVYSVKVEWTVDTAKIDIDQGGLYVWSTENLKYELQGSNEAFALNPDGNSSVDVTITFTNRSNADVAYDIAYADNATDKLTTSEDLTAEATVAKTGKVNSADTQEGVATTENTEGTGHDYIINADAENFSTEGAAGEVTYNGTVTVTKVEDGADFEAEGAKNLTLGTYTVTLSAYVAPAEEP